MDELTSVFYAPGRGAPLHRPRRRSSSSPSPRSSCGSSRAAWSRSRRSSSATTSAAAASTRSRTSCSGPVASFVAVASIMVDYILTACISTVSAVINGTAFLPLSAGQRVRARSSRIIWGVAGLNILGIRENARVTFGIFVAAALRVREPDRARRPAHRSARARRIMLGQRARACSASITQRRRRRTSSRSITIGVASCVLAYSGIESVIQTAGLVRELARHREGLLVPRAHGRHRHAGGLGARALGAHRPARRTRATSSRTARRWSATCRSACWSASSAASS